MAMSVCVSVGWLVGWCHLAFQQHLVHVAALFSLVQSGLDQCRPIQSTLVKSSPIQSNLVKSSQIQKNLFQAISGRIQHMWRLFIVQSSLDQTREDQFSLTLVKASQIQSNLDKSFLGYFRRHFWLHQTFIGSQLLFLAQSSLVQTSVHQFSLLQSNLVKSSQIQKNIFWNISGSIQHMQQLFIVQSSLDQ